MMRFSAGLIGSNIQKTRLPFALDLMCNETGLEIDFELIDTAGDPDFDFDATIKRLMDEAWRGVTVTHPHKLQAARFAGAGMIDAVAHLSASNTLIFGDTVEGYNTDYTGFLSAWNHGMHEQDLSTVAMAGAGGVASALGPAFIKLGAGEIRIWDIDQSKAETLVSELGPKAWLIEPDDIAEAARSASGLVNATALGMEQYPGSAFEQGLLGKQGWAFDAVYTPTNTEFLNNAAAAGLKTMSGFELFKHMAVGSFEAYSGISLDLEHILPKLDALRPD